MNSGQVFWLHASALITALSGAVFAVMKYFMTGSDEFAVVNHPWQPWMLAVHVVVAPLFLFMLGWTFSNHMIPQTRHGSHRARFTGQSSMWLIVPMAFSGYLMQIATNDAIRQAMAIAHWSTSALFAVIYLAHLVRYWLEPQEGPAGAE
ncbi:MAG TPA: hypothetical protein VHL59_04190 [Thermoanaerobaculia bacterium]|nr:hypothetical protein [Thermoanaerobaculia bacterium]